MSANNRMIIRPVPRGQRTKVIRRDQPSTARTLRVRHLIHHSILRSGKNLGHFELFGTISRIHGKVICFHTVHTTAKHLCVNNDCNGSY